MCCSMRQVLRLAVGCFCAVDALAAGRAAARGEGLAAFDERCIPTPPQRGCRVGGPGAGGVAPPSNTPGIATPPRKPRAAGAPVLGRRALPAGRLARLGATPDFHHGLLTRTNVLEFRAPCPMPDFFVHPTLSRSQSLRATSFTACCDFHFGVAKARGHGGYGGNGQASVSSFLRVWPLTPSALLSRPAALK